MEIYFAGFDNCLADNCPTRRGAGAGRKFIVSVISPRRIPVSDSARSQGVLVALRELGYIDGQHIAMEYRYAAGNRDQAVNLAAELVRLKVDILIVAGGTVWVRAAKNATKTIPIVMTGAGLDPVEAGLVAKPCSPGRKRYGAYDTVYQRNRRKAAGAAEGSRPQSCPRRGSLRSDRSRHCTRGKRGSSGRGACAGIDYSAWEVRDADGFEKLFAALSKQRPDALHVTGGPDMRANAKSIARFALTSRLPSIIRPEMQ